MIPLVSFHKGALYQQFKDDTMKKDKRVFIKAFGENEHGMADFPVKISNIQVSRMEFGNRMGCSYCFPHGYETVNATVSKNTRNWKNHRKNQYKPK
ncbi:MAG: phosphate ABC transporter substrate-binding protein [Bacteroidia bacterium]